MKNKNGITLIALIVTIIVLLILVTVGANMITGSNGILDKAQLAKDITNTSSIEEQNKLSETNNIIESYTTSRSSGDVTYCTTPATSLTTSSASSTNPCVVTESYRNGTSWCRVWSDGWIEQGGYVSISVTAISSSFFGNTTFIKPYSDTNYNITLGRCENANDFDSATLLYSKTKTYATILAYNTRSTATQATYWYACGY